MEAALAFEQLTHWHWFIGAAVLVILEMAAPGVVFLWLGLAAGATGLGLLIWPDMAWETQFFVFALLSLVSVAGGRMWLRARPVPTDQPVLNRRGEQYVGRRFTLAEPIVNGVGKIRVDDTTWKVAGPDMEAGSPVEVTGVDGVILTVASIEKAEG